MRFCLLMAAPATWTAGGPGAGVGSRRQVSSAEAEGRGSPCPGHSALRPGRPPLLPSPLPPLVIRLLLPPPLLVTMISLIFS